MCNAKPTCIIHKLFISLNSCKACRDSWEHEGPMVPGLDAMDASDRLRKFKQTFEVMKGKWDNYSSGEELFGLAMTRYPGALPLHMPLVFRSCRTACAGACGVANV